MKLQRLMMKFGAADGDLVIYHWFEYMPAELLSHLRQGSTLRWTRTEAMLASLKAGHLRRCRLHGCNHG